MSNVLITGANRGIGAAITRHLASCGHTVFAGTRQPDAIDSAILDCGDVRPLRLDVTSQAHVDDAVDKINGTTTGVDILINNAGVAWFAAAEEMSEFVLRTTLETNFFGAVRCTRAVLPGMRAQGSGHVIMLSSIAAATSRSPRQSFASSKAPA